MNDMSIADRNLHSGQPDPQQQRPLPESLEAEQAVLGAVLVNSAALGAIMSRVNLEPAHFYEPLHRDMFEGVIDLSKQGKSISPITIRPYVSSYANINGMNHAQYAANLAAGAVNIVNAPFIAENIVASHAAREAIYLAREIEDVAYGQWHESGFIDAVGKLSSALVGAVEEAKARDMVSPGDAYMERYAVDLRDKVPSGVAIRIKAMRDVMGEDEFEAGNYYGLLGASSEGKTSLTLMLITSALRDGHPVLFLSYDQSPEQCVSQMIAQHTGISVKQQRDPYRLMSSQERDTCAEFAVMLNRQPFQVIRCHRELNARLINYAGRFCSRHKGKTDKRPLVVVDHIRKIPPRNERASSDVQAGEINAEWKSFADEQKCSVLMLNQRNGEMNRRKNSRPIKRDVYGGEGAIQDYDTMLYIYRPVKYKRDALLVAENDREIANINRIYAEFGDDMEIETVTEIGALKVRFGDPSIRKRLQFEAKFTRFKSQDDADDFDAERVLF